MHGIQRDEVEFQNCTSLVKYKYILVHTGIYRYVLVHTSKTPQTSFDHAPSSLRRLRVSAERLAWSFFTVFYLMEISSTVRRRTTQARLSTAKVPQPSVNLVHVAATPAIRSCRVCTPQGKSGTLALAELMVDCRG